MENNIDDFFIELIVIACQMESKNIWMQGYLEIKLNSEKPYTDNEIINVNDFLKSLEQDGEFFIFSCCCGLPECGDWKFGIQVLHLDKNVQWKNLNNGKTWLFNKAKIETNLREIQEEIANYKQFFIQKDIKYVGIDL